MFGSRKTKTIRVRGYGSSEDEAYEHALKVADRKYEIFTSKRIRKVRGENAYDITFEVYDRGTA